MTLVGPALACFRQLPKKFMDNFEDLCTQFINQYNSNRQQQKTMADLHRLVLNEDESPQQYLTRFMEVMNMIYDAYSVAAASSFIKGLLPGSMLFEDLIKNTPYDMAEITERAERMFRVLESIEKLSRKVTAISVKKRWLQSRIREIICRVVQAGIKGRRMIEGTIIDSIDRISKLKSPTSS